MGGGLRTGRGQLHHINVCFMATNCRARRGATLCVTTSVLEWLRDTEEQGRGYWTTMGRPESVCEPWVKRGRGWRASHSVGRGAEKLSVSLLMSCNGCLKSTDWKHFGLGLICCDVLCSFKVDSMGVAESVINEKCIS